MTTREDEMVEQIERLNDWLVETQMLAHKWMVAHDKLKAGKPYDFPQPADLPNAVAALSSERDLLVERVAELETKLARCQEHNRKMLRARLDAAKRQRRRRAALTGVTGG